MNKFKLNINIGVYGCSSGSYCFVKKVNDTTFEALHTPALCKDYTHETIASFIHGIDVGYPLFRDRKDGFLEDFAKLQLVIFLPIEDADAKKRLYSIKKYLSAIEKECNVKQTLITELDVTAQTSNKNRAFLLTFSKIYVESPALLHGFLAFMRTMYIIKEEVTTDNFVALLNSTKVRDYSVLSFVVKHDIFRLVMTNHTKIMEGLTLKDIYPIQVTNTKKDRILSYHSGFGMVALCTHTLASKAYSDKITKLLEDNKIPNYA